MNWSKLKQVTFRVAVERTILLGLLEEVLGLLDGSWMLIGFVICWFANLEDKYETNKAQNKIKKSLPHNLNLLQRYNHSNVD